ncbi:MAG: clostripain-related cysteine peptidase [candidate division Zixibacteria bacterium]|nr:clostripain-related cysteine peptidase [candidate division Zixibacteria bacterium]
MVKKSRVFWIALTVLAIFLSPGCSKKPTKPEPPKYKWTILGYFDGNNSQDLDPVTLGSYVIQDVQEMEQVGSTKDVQIILMLGSIKTEGNCNYYLIEKYSDEPADSISSKVLDSLGKKDMSDPQTLTDFIQYGVKHYSAQRYMLIINDHGSGWKGVSSDEQNGDGKMMSLPELSSALFGYKFEIIVFNAPSMSLLEVAYQLKDKANYLIASQFKRGLRTYRLSSSEWLQDLIDDPDIGSRDLTRNMVDTIFHTAVNKYKDIHIAAINLAKVNILASRVADLGNSLTTKAGAYWNEVLANWDSVHSQVYDDSAYMDLKGFAKKIQNPLNHLDSAIKNDAKAVEIATGEAVIKSLSNRDWARGGLSIHFPWKVSLFDSTDYVQLDFASSNWHVFLSHFIPSISSSLGGLEVISIPDGAEIYLNGQDTEWKTNTTIYGLLPGWYDVKVVKGYKEAEGGGKVESGKIITIYFVL